MSEPATRPVQRPPGTIRVGSVAGADVLVSSSWFLVAGLIAVLVAPRVEQVSPGLGPWKYVAGIAFAVIFYGSILLHEAAHAFMAKRFGYPVISITMHFLGGFTQIEGEARRPREEFWIAVVGPLTSIAVGIVGVGLWLLEPEGLLLMSVEGLAAANLLVGVLNLLPGLPLDGGRVLKAGVWGLTANVHKGTIAAGWGGRILAVAALAWPWAASVIWGFEPTLVDYALAAIIALFLWAGASTAMASAQIRRRLPALVARDIARKALAISGDVALDAALGAAADAKAGAIVTLDSGGRPAGVVNETALLATPLERRSEVPVSSVARTLIPGLTLPVGIAGEELIKAISRVPAAEYLLVESTGEIFGVLVTADVDEAFRTIGR